LLMSISHRVNPGSRRRRFSRGLLTVTTIESIDAAGRINQLLLAREKRVTSRTNFNMQIALPGRARLERLAARAGHCDFAVFRMNSGFHFFLALYSCHLSVSINMS
jgi:hypothetical protein